jgi:hypothetical protein
MANLSEDSLMMTVRRCSWLWEDAGVCCSPWNARRHRLLRAEISKVSIVALPTTTADAGKSAIRNQGKVEELVVGFTFAYRSTSVTVLEEPRDNCVGVQDGAAKPTGKVEESSPPDLHELG